MLRFFRKNEYKDSIQETTLQAFIPGVNSGAYEKTICFDMSIVTYKWKLFGLKKYINHSRISLTQSEFATLTNEIKKINNLSN